MTTRTGLRSGPPTILILIAAACTCPASAQTRLYDGGEWDFESGFVFVPHMLAGKISQPPEGKHPSEVSGDKWANIGVGWKHYASFPPPEWSGPPADWPAGDHWGVASFNENKNLANVSHGSFSQEITLTCANGVGIIYRREKVPADHRIRLEADLKFTPNGPDGPEIEIWMGMDPAGRDDPRSKSVHWFRCDRIIPNTFERRHVEVAASGDTMTFFIMMLHRIPICRGATFMVDNVEVYDLGPARPGDYRDPPPWPLRQSADFDGDGDVDDADFAVLQECWSEATDSGGSSDCQRVDLDGSGLLDLADLGIFLRCAGGPSTRFSPNCQ